jgi:hypothetical protein
MICPACDNPGVDIIESLTIVPTPDYTPAFKQEGILSCPCGAYFNWRTREVLVPEHEGTIKKWWTQIPSENIVSKLELTVWQRELLTYLIENYKVTVVPYGDSRYFYLRIPNNLRVYEVAVVIDQLRGNFQSWQYHNDIPGNGAELLIQYR